VAGEVWSRPQLDSSSICLTSSRQGEQMTDDYPVEWFLYRAQVTLYIRERNRRAATTRPDLQGGLSGQG
jgi:hypothetical protein